MILLDTHVALWLGEDSRQLSPIARRSIQAAVEDGEDLMLSSVSLYEIARAVHRGRIQTTLSIHALLSAMERRFVISAVTPAIALAAAQLPAEFPSDPFDRIIAATALTEDIPLLTADQRIRKSRALRTLW
ncbi:MAG TPA: type II toxin-antitoxin system VapC family toxin [Acidobacteriaceae bacterium]|nr:type II toxin-antitoxin system VapC family toxin [Acidobacteriaceae bacterium]